VPRVSATNASAITSVRAWEALDSRGRPTVACTVHLADGSRGKIVVPSGASTGTYEATELRDGGTRYGGYGVRTAITNVTDVLAPAVIGRDASNQQDIDQRLRDLDGTSNLARLGANAVLAVSLAVWRAVTSPGTFPGCTDTVRLPLPMFTIPGCAARDISPLPAGPAR